MKLSLAGRPSAQFLLSCPAQRLHSVTRRQSILFLDGAFAPWGKPRIFLCWFNYSGHGSIVAPSSRGLPIPKPRKAYHGAPCRFPSAQFLFGCQRACFYRQLSKQTCRLPFCITADAQAVVLRLSLPINNSVMICLTNPIRTAINALGSGYKGCSKGVSK